MIERLRVRIPAEVVGEFSSPESTLCALIRCPFHPCVTAVTHKRHRSVCQKCRWQVTLKHVYTHDPTKSEWADYAAVQALCGNLSGNELTLDLSGNIRPQLSQLAEPPWTDPGIKKSGISAGKLISIKQKQANRQKKRQKQTNKKTKKRAGRE